MILTGAAGSVTFDVSQKSKIPKLKMRVTSTTCDEAYGEWAYTLKQAFQKQGFKASMDGNWLGFRETEATNAEVEKLLAASHLQGEGAPSFDSGSPLLDMAGALLRRYNDFVDRFPNWPMDDVADLFGDTESILNSIRNLTECDRRLFGEDNVEQFSNGLTLVLQNLITSTANLGGMSGQQWQVLAQAAFRAGVLGPGAANPALAVAAEQALIDAGEGILASNVDPEDGKIWVNDETEAVMGTAAASGWTLHVNGTAYDARSTWSDAFGDTWPQNP